MHSMTPEDCTRFVQIIGQVLISDGVLGDAEREHLDRLMDELKLDDAARKAALSGINMDSPVEERVGALSPAAKGQLLEAVERAAGADGETSKSETMIVEKVRSLLS